MAAQETVNAFFSLEVPGRLVDQLVTLQRDNPEHIDPQKREHIHITLAFVHDADAGKLADAVALVNEHTWPTPVVAFSGEVRHGSWVLTGNPEYHYDPDVIQKGEQVRLGVEFNTEISSVHSEITRTLDLPEEEYWPHSTLGLARGDTPYTWTETLRVPAERELSPALRLHQSVGGDFRLLARRTLTGA